MTKTEIYEALARDQWMMLENRFGSQEEFFKFQCETDVLRTLLANIMFGDFNPDDWRMRKENDERG